MCESIAISTYLYISVYISIYRYKYISQDFFGVVQVVQASVFWWKEGAIFSRRDDPAEHARAACVNLRRERWGKGRRGRGIAWWLRMKLPCLNLGIGGCSVPFGSFWGDKGTNLPISPVWSFAAWLRDLTGPGGQRTPSWTERAAYGVNLTRLYPMILIQLHLSDISQYDMWVSVRLCTGTFLLCLLKAYQTVEEHVQQVKKPTSVTVPFWILTIGAQLTREMSVAMLRLLVIHPAIERIPNFLYTNPYRLGQVRFQSSSFVRFSFWLVLPHHICRMYLRILILDTPNNIEPNDHMLLVRFR